MGEVAEVSLEPFVTSTHTISTTSRREQQSLQVITVTVNPFGEAATATSASFRHGQSGDSGHHHIEPNPQEAWLPITESRKGNACSSVFHLLCSGIGFQALALPVAFASLGWFWGTLCLSMTFVWQLYTIWLLVHLHESVTGTRYSRYLRLSIAAFGAKMGKLLSIFPVMYLSGGTCVMLIITGGGTLELLSQTMYGDGSTHNAKILSGAEWFLVFTCLAIAVALFFHNLNSIAMVSLLGAITAVGYCTLIWVLSVTKGRPDGVSHDPSKTATSHAARIRGILNAVGIIAIAFRGHNVVLEIQGTMPSSTKHPSHEPMWRGVIKSYVLISLCIFPLAIGGYWAYGNMIAANGGMLGAFSKFHRHNTSKFVKVTIYLLVVINCLSAFQIYAMPALDNLEFAYSSKKNKPCPGWLRKGFRVFFGGLTFFVAVALPFLGSLAPLLGGLTLPLTFAYPCFMWIAIKKPRPNSAMWCLNLGLGSFGMGTMHSSPEHPSREPMWRGVTKYICSNFIVYISSCNRWILGIWKHETQHLKVCRGHNIPATSDKLFKRIPNLRHASFGQLGVRLQQQENNPCPGWLRKGFRVLFGGFTFFVAVALPFLGSLALLIGGLTLPLTFVYPCFMWIAIKKLRPNSAMRYLNLVLGSFGMVLSILLVAAATWNIASKGMDANFFHPH
ncbi:hypothetical protein F0562_028426 [Nyssa sinensis]|uniref:Amino acid transporter transmembrane domain-containing protein n=1 Tax=Nyssa sinensis TaxID=561372 RepID=A0A5J5B086_9ASTE|nr:hypothetical protein F0562_028426 [Nyssa sinensis]